MYEKEGTEYKGPRYHTATRDIVAPDLLCFKGKEIRWVEAKHKKVFSWHRKSSSWVTGIDINHWMSYLDLASRLPVWLMFLHSEWRSEEREEPSPVGLYGNLVTELEKKISHTSNRHGRHGMIYWAVDSLIHCATLAQVGAANR